MVELSISGGGQRLCRTFRNESRPAVPSGQTPGFIWPAVSSKTATAWQCVWRKPNTQSAEVLSIYNRRDLRFGRCNGIADLSTNLTRLASV